VKTVIQNESSEKQIVRKKTVEFLLKEIDRRYELDNLKSIDQIKQKKLLKGITQEDIDRLKAFFTSTIYPPVEKRHRRDKSFQSLVKMLKNPHKLTFIIPSIPKIMFKYSTMFPAALRTGLNTVLSYTLSNKLENLMVDNLMRIYEARGTKIDKDLQIREADFHQAYVKVPYSEGKRMIGLANSVMKAGKQERLVKTTWEIMDDVQNALIRKDKELEKSGQAPQHRDDADAIEYGKSVLEGVMNVFGNMKEETVERMISVAYLTENNYLERMYGNK